MRRGSYFRFDDSKQSRQGKCRENKQNSDRGKNLTRERQRKGNMTMQNSEEAIKKLQRRQKATQSRQTGALFEKMVDGSLEWYRGRGDAEIQKTPEPMKPIKPTGRGGQFIACYTKQAQPDYKGTLKGGRAVVFDAKHTDADKIESSRVTEEQREELDSHYNLGACAFILVSFSMKEFYRIPWPVWKNMQDLYGRKHMKKVDCEPFRVPYMAGVIKLLEGIEGGRICENRAYRC